jgi:uncharacterized membrane protein YhiD involved in acid resistance
MADRILPTTAQGWLAMAGIGAGLLSGIAGSAVASHAWLLATVEHVHVSLSEIDRQRDEIEADLYLLDKMLENMDPGPDRDAVMERRGQKQSELDRLNGL